ncbi:Alpha/beta hydrolase fold-1 [Xylariaceae sp. FL0594]|nr:Alpha/beta hydrolase fold-1 [Xylariaceae sp. FL0594]
MAVSGPQSSLGRILEVPRLDAAIQKPQEPAVHMADSTTAAEDGVPSKPCIILISGAWHLPEVWNKVKTRLEAAGYEVYAPRLSTVVGAEPVNYSWRFDVAVVHDLAIPLFARGRRAVIVGHSYGGAVTTASLEGQTLAERQKRGLVGGFIAAVYICAFPLIHRGFSLLSTLGGKYSDWQIPSQLPSTVPSSIGVVLEQAPFYSDLPPDEAEEWVAKLQFQSKRSVEEPVEYTANDANIPMTYLLCESDKAVPIQAQETMVAAIPSMKIRRCTAGHSPFLSQPDMVVDVIIEAARESR